MGRLNHIHFLTAVILLLLIVGCGGAGRKAATDKSPVQAAVVEVNNEARLLLKNLEDIGDYVNSKNFPSLIKASIVHEESGLKNHIIDLRTSDLFSKGHVKGAVNVPFTGLPGYLESKIKPFEYDKIILVCNTGQVSGYATSLLRLMGYGNVYAMRWGMSGWNKKFAGEYWLKEISGKYEDKLETIDNPAAKPAGLPVLSTGKATGDEIREARFRAVMGEGAEVALITADEVFQNPANYYIINLERKDKYDSGHIPGAVRYKQNGTLGILSEMQTIPADKTIVLYCGTGHNSAFATAYLRFFGYNAKTLVYGNNAFMLNKMISEKAALSWLPFSAEDINDFEVVK